MTGKVEEMMMTTMKRKRILVAVDESEESMYALSWCLANYKTTMMLGLGMSSDALKQQQQDSSQIILLHVKRRALVLPGKDREETAEMYNHDVLSSQEWRDSEMARWIIEKANKICQNHNVKDVESRIEEGEPRDVICNMVDTLDPHLLVMGSHGYGPTARALVGSVSTDCVQKATCPVLVVKKPKSKLN